jgi:hypothetical protein
MKRPITVVLCFVLLLVGIILVSHSATPAHAQGRSCTIPKAFGTLRGEVEGNLLFEAPNGTISIVNWVEAAGTPCGAIFKIQRQ